jgi:bifunctional non-homologous end joining protein LigD
VSAISVAVLRSAFNLHPSPTLAKEPPVGPEWLHEVKFDGWRAQAHVRDGEVALYSKNGAALTKRFAALEPIVRRLPVKSAIIDCELVACDHQGMPSFSYLMTLGGKAPALCLWAFDLLYLDGVRITPPQLHDRRAMLAQIIAAADTKHLQFSGDFPDPIKLLNACEKMGLEGIVSKRRTCPYRSGPTREWIKVKTATWRLANCGRWEMFEPKRTRRR